MAGSGGRERRTPPRPAERRTKARSGVVVRMLWGRAAMSEWRAKAVRIAQDGRSSPGDARMGFRGSAARAAGAPSCAHQDGDGASAKRERWFDHARAMIEGKSLAKTAELCGVHPTTAFRWRHRFLGAPAADKPRKLSGIVEADETFILNPSRAGGSDLPRKARKRGGPARHPVLYSDNIPVLVARTGGARPSTQSCRRTTAPRSERRWPAS